MDKIKVIAFDLVGTLISSEDWESLSKAHLQVITAFLARTQASYSGEDMGVLLERNRKDLAKRLGREPTLVEVFSSLGVENKTFLA